LIKNIENFNIFTINLKNLINSFGELNLTMAAGGSTNFSAVGLATASNLTVELIKRFISVQLREVSKRVDGLEEKLTSDANIVEDYNIEEEYETTLEVIKSSLKFTGQKLQ